MTRHGARQGLLGLALIVLGGAVAAGCRRASPVAIPAALPDAGVTAPAPQTAPDAQAAAPALPRVDATRLWAALYAASRIANIGEDMACGGSAGQGCWDALLAHRQDVILALSHALSRVGPSMDDAAACALRLDLRRWMAVLENGRKQAAYADDSNDDGYCVCSLRPVALPGELERLADALALRCPAPVSPCTVTMPASFHLRDAEIHASVGRELPAGTRVDLLLPQLHHQGAEQMYLVALASDGAVGSTYVPTALVPAACQLPAAIGADRQPTADVLARDRQAIAALVAALDHAVTARDEVYLREHLAFPVVRGTAGVGSLLGPRSAAAFLQAQLWTVPGGFVARCRTGDPHQGDLNCRSAPDREANYAQGPAAILVEGNTVRVLFDAARCDAGASGPEELGFVRGPDGWRLGAMQLD